jgi:hypothetical protein
MKKIILVLIIMAFVSVAVYAAEEKLGSGDFVSNTITDAFNKLSQYASGERKLLDWGVYTEQGKGRKPDALEQKLNNVHIKSGPISPASAPSASPVAQKQQ